MKKGKLYGLFFSCIILCSCGAGPAMIEPHIYFQPTVSSQELAILTNANETTEPVLPNKAVHQLSYPATQIISVRRAVDGSLIDSSNYAIDSQGRLLLSASIMLPTNWADVQATGNPYAAQGVRKDGTHLRLSFDYHVYQLSVTYSHSPTGQTLSPIVFGKAQNIVSFVGDSITAGGDSTQQQNVYPFQKKYQELVCGYMPSNTICYNYAVGGTSSDNGVEQFKNAVASDIVFIAFGMNDQSATVSKANFKANVIQTMQAFLGKNQNTRFILVSSMRPEVTWVYSHAEYLDYYKDAMLEIVSENPSVNIKISDVTAAFDLLLTRKRFVDVCGNGVNHPNDFGHLLYAKTIIKTLNE